MNMEWSEQALGDEVAALRFALIDLALFLDTHPADAGALAAFAEHREKYLALCEQYVSLFGPLEMYDTTGKNGWTWGEMPMPYEGGR